VARDRPWRVGVCATGLHGDQPQVSKHNAKIVLGCRVGEKGADGPMREPARVCATHAGVAAAGIAPRHGRGLVAHRHELERDGILGCRARASGVEPTVSVFRIMSIAIARERKNVGGVSDHIEHRP
jgi:hypothetical protein